MSETWKMYIWMAIALIDTYILIKDQFKGGNRGNDRKFVSRSKRK
jgi:hypothetical protein